MVDVFEQAIRNSIYGYTTYENFSWNEVEKISSHDLLILWPDSKEDFVKIGTICPGNPCVLFVLFHLNELLDFQSLPPHWTVKQIPTSGPNSKVPVSSWHQSARKILLDAFSDLFTFDKLRQSCKLFIRNPEEILNKNALVRK